MLRVADLGVADGINTGPFVSHLVSIAKERVDDIELILIDLPKNNWAAVVAASGAWVRAAAALGVNVHVRMTPASFYDVYAPPSSVDLIWSATALHWAAPGIVEQKDVAGLRCRWQDLPPADPLRVKFEARISRDLSCILSRAACALRVGGCLVAAPAALQLARDGAPSRSTVRRTLAAWLRDPETAPLALTWIVGMNLVPLSRWEEAVRSIPTLTLAASAVAPMDDAYWRDAPDAQSYATEHAASLWAVAGKAWDSVPAETLSKARSAANAAAVADFEAVPRADRYPWGYSALFWAERH
jgi:hypothetical protein